jgi:hypothetical protein
MGERRSAMILVEDELEKKTTYGFLGIALGLTQDGDALEKDSSMIKRSGSRRFQSQ